MKIFVSEFKIREGPNYINNTFIITGRLRLIDVKNISKENINGAKILDELIIKSKKNMIPLERNTLGYLKHIPEDIFTDFHFFLERSLELGKINQQYIDNPLQVVFYNKEKDLFFDMRKAQEIIQNKIHFNNIK